MICLNLLNCILFCKIRNQTGEEPLVAEAAAEIQNYCFNYRDQLLAGIIVAGWDKQKGGQVYQVPLGGMCIRRGYGIGGSGSSYVHGFIREFYRDGMSRNETVEFVKKGKSKLISLYVFVLETCDEAMSDCYLSFQPFSMQCTLTVVRVVFVVLESLPKMASIVKYSLHLSIQYPHNHQFQQLLPYDLKH